MCHKFGLLGAHIIGRTLSAAQTVIEGRAAVENILRGNDDRLLVVVG